MFLKKLTKGLLVKRKTSTDRQPTGFLQNNSVATQMLQNLAVTTLKINDLAVTTAKIADAAVTPIKLSTKYENFDAVVGSAGQVTAGLATHSTFASAIAAVSAGGTIYILPGSYTENVVLAKRVFLLGHGHASSLNGTFTMNAGAEYSVITWMRFADNVTINSNGCFFKENFLAATKTVTNSGSGNGVTWIQE